MPPVPINNDLEVAEQLALSDQDVQLLYQIVTRAELYPDVETHTFRALFREYHTVLSENNIEPETDQICLRFLFLLGKHRRGDTLYTRFESLLLQMGIQLLTDPTTNANGLSYMELENRTEANDTRELPVRPNGTGINRRRQRRASFNSIYDAPTDTTHWSIPRPPSRSSLSRLDIDNSNIAAVRPKRRASFSGVDDRGSLLLEFEPELHRPRGSNDRYPSDYNNVFPLELDLRLPGLQQQQMAAYDDGFATDSDQFEYQSPQLKVPPELFYQPSLSNLLMDASIFNSYRERKIARHLLVSWHEQARRRQQAVQAMYRVAINRDRATLLRQGLEEWRLACEEKQLEARTDRFFKHLEARAVRARNLYLLTKAFTHWAQVASDEIERTNAARKRIIGIKYLNAWKEITAVTELKIQRLTLKMPFGFWTSKIKQLQLNETRASEFYRDHLIRRMYWHWYWSFCYNRAPQRADHRLKQRSLISWLRAFRTHGEQDAEIDSKRKQMLLRSVLDKWSQRTRSITTSQQTAHSWHLERVVRFNFTEWRVQHRLGAVTTRVSQVINNRLVRSAFSTWSYQAYMQRLAHDMNYQRLIRNAWTTWNDKLRCRALSMRADARVVMQSLYKWVLIERLHFMVRIRERRLKSTALTTLLNNSSVLYTQLLRSEEEFRIHRKKEISCNILHIWRKKLFIQRQREHVALTFYAPRVEQEALEHWKNRKDHHAKLETWAKNARYFFLMTKTLKQWRAVAQQASKKRKQDAYVTVRRKLKVNLVCDALATWRSRLISVSDMEQRAMETYQRKLFEKAIHLFDQWRSSTVSRLKQVEDADVYYNRQLTYNNLGSWVGSSRLYQTQEEKAARFLELHVSAVALVQLKKLSLRVFQVKTDYEKADAANDRILRKHLRNMLFHWTQRSRTLRTTKEDVEHITTPGSRYDAQFFDENEQWENPESTLRISDLGVEHDPVSHTPVPTPGYLTSPSKRAARARSLYQISTTPATPAITPFAVRLMAARDPPRSLPGRRTLYAKSPLATSVRFAIEEESEPESPTDGRSTNRNLG
ncbi:hypothetical protein LOZ61_002980 [Ophidiomyces ophidiicola]|uniref:uncharacterized protein n=1 Tax=Ophidiomyces ophidiicola TaxID=1387563 RepID=UPI0020C2EECC|nr:uncharacterized protein LOZ57_003352 [Ophidiomyces ophidiicola]KAI1913003.1 hypothetical protein LOZ61_002980 [Ophidiomyces ophidiicola]KAI1920923.1 hypothetical protein LOZ60_006383 [Ophidiomyces ophidiicola]KAI1947114.1 hypothetical protein LOZ57_003352 [Ophidiomyces ophidiicola]KAI1948870.1 hypothetical protein LOZ59_006245 [Ophidiomyces ophidiicola]KAI2004617.1 hypothetical protein LOZ49_005777 [Ophidiomyces ophidiicola]